MEGRRIRKRLHRPDADGVRSVRFVYDTDGRLVSETRRRDDRSAVKARDIVWLGSLPLAQIERRVRGDGTTRSADVLSLHPGHLGELREARDASGTVVWRWGGDAFGAKIGGTPAVNRDPDGDGVNTSVSLRFPGQYHDRESGLFYNHHRDYDPKLGRYIQSDPIGLAGGVNRYGYVSGDPVNFVDPTGLVRDTGRCTGSRTCSGLARTFVYSGNITDCYVWDTYTNGTYTGTSPGGCNYSNFSGSFNTIGGGNGSVQFADLGIYNGVLLLDAIKDEFDRRVDSFVETACGLVQQAAAGTAGPLITNPTTPIDRAINNTQDALRQSYPWLSYQVGGSAVYYGGAGLEYGFYAHTDGRYGVFIRPSAGVGMGAEVHATMGISREQPGGFSFGVQLSGNFLRAAGNVNGFVVTNLDSLFLESFQGGPSVGAAGTAMLSYTASRECGNYNE